MDRSDQRTRQDLVVNRISQADADTVIAKGHRVRTARIHDWNSAPVIEELAEPVRRAGETLVKVDAATISHLDLTVATGEFALRPPLPYVPGVEGAATVLESKTLDRGSQAIFRDGTMGLDRDGTWREYASVPDDALVPLEVRLDPAVAATFFVPTTTAYIALHDIGGLEPGQTVLVSGATGAVGSMAVQVARAAGARVIALVSRSSRLAGLPDGVEGVALDDAYSVGKLATERPADLLLDTIGGEGLGQRIGWVTFGGKVVCLGYTAGTTFAVDLPNWFFTDVAILPVNLMSREKRAQQVARQLLPEFAAGRLRLEVSEFPLEQAAAALELLSTGRIRGRAVIRF